MEDIIKEIDDIISKLEYGNIDKNDVVSGLESIKEQLEYLENPKE